MRSFTVSPSFPKYLCLMAFAWLLTGSVAHAQEPLPAGQAQAPAHISIVDGVAILERDGETDDSPGSMPLLAGDRVRTRAGRVEILFADGSTLHLDHHTAIDLQSDELLRLVDGRIRLSIPGPSRDVGYRIDGPHGWAQIAEPGEYRLSLSNGPRGSELELAVLRGRAELANEDGATPLRAGERAFARAGAAPSYPYVANSAASDAFDRWSEARRDERRSASAEYLPEEVRPYSASFARYGDWRDEPTYGRVWYPRVETDWRPYYRGRWVQLRPYGWTWIAHDPWGWPTHHYGRWGYANARWFWIPGRTWGAAWVSWAYAPGYVSWCPLGWNNRPVFQINITLGSRGYDPWRAWTVIPQRHFGYGYVHRNVVRIDHLDYRSRPSFAYRDRAPEFGGRAVPRGSTPIRVAGTHDGRRGASPVFTNVPSDRSRVTSDGPRVRVPERSRQGAPARSSQPEYAPRATPRERAVPDRPAVRSDRPAPLSPRDRAESPAWNAPSGSRARPRIEERQSPQPAPAPAYSAPAYRRPAEAPRPEPRGVDRAPAEAPRERRAVPRGDDGRPPAEYGRPSGGERPPQAERRGPDRPAAGSYERRAPAASQPPSGEGGRGGSRPASPPRGARPRPGGGGN